MTIREEITIEELIVRIADGLARSCSGEYVTEIANRVLVGTHTYLKDEQVVVEHEEDFNHG